jgi:hypothetical protein
MPFNPVKRSIDSKFLTLISLVKKIGLSKTDFDDILAWGEVYGRLLYINHAGIYRDDDFEQKLISGIAPAKKLAPANLPELHVISAPLSAGGHTRLMEKIIFLRKGGDVLVTRPLLSLKDKLRLPAETMVYQETSGFTLTQLIDIISSYKTVFLYISPDDLLASAAVGIAKQSASSRVIFVNHADHVFSFGFCNCDLVAEVSSYGFFLSTEKRNVRSSFVGIPVELDGLDQIEFDGRGTKNKNKFFEIFSAGSGIKYRPGAAHSFAELAGSLLKEISTARITVVGPQVWTDWWWWMAKLKNPARLRILPSMPYDKYMSTLAHADIYLDSFPMTGGTALPEIRSKGIPVSGLLSGSFGYTPFDAAKFSDIDGLVLAVKDYAEGNQGEICLKNNCQNTISTSHSVHGFSALKDRLDGMVNNDFLFQPYDADTAFNIDFYKNQWRTDGVIRVDLGSLIFFLKSWAAGGKTIMPLLIGLLSFKQVFSLINSIFAKLISR